METNTYSLEELSERTGIEPRTIRSYIQQGLMKGPESLGRNAFYVDYHLERLLKIKKLKEFYGLSLKEIRHMLMTGGDRDLDVSGTARFFHESSEPLGPQSADSLSALEFIRQVKGLGGTPKPARPGAVGQGSTPQSRDPLTVRLPGVPGQMRGAPLEQLLSYLRGALGRRRVQRIPRGEPWVHIDITPDLKLMVRGDLGVDEVALLEQLAAAMRELILGGTDNDNTGY